MSYIQKTQFGGLLRHEFMKSKTGSKKRLPGIELEMSSCEGRSSDDNENGNKEKTDAMESGNSQMMAKAENFS